MCPRCLSSGLPSLRLPRRADGARGSGPTAQDRPRAGRRRRARNAHIGVIRALEELNIPIDYIAGTSMGSIVGGLYSCGFTPDEMQEIIETIKWATLFQDAPDRPEQSFRQKEDDFDHLFPMEFGLDLKKGGLVLPPGLIAGSKLGFVLESDDASLRLGGAISTSCGFRFVRSPRISRRALPTSCRVETSPARSARAWPFRQSSRPVEIDGHLLVDGGESENLPVQTVRAMGADIVIAVNVGSSGAEIAKKPTNVGADDRSPHRPSPPAEHDGLGEARRPRHHTRSRRATRPRISLPVRR